MRLTNGKQGHRMGKIYSLQLPNQREKNAYDHVFLSGIAKSKLDSLNKSIGEGLECNAFIRLTNPGAVIAFERKYAVGKPLWAKAKSSDAFFCKANVAACPALAKNRTSTNDEAKIIEKLQGSNPGKSGLSTKVVHKHIINYPNHPLLDAIHKKEVGTAPGNKGESFYLKEKIRGLTIHYLLIPDCADPKADESALQYLYKNRRSVLASKELMEDRQTTNRFRLLSVYFRIEGLKQTSDYSCLSTPTSISATVNNKASQFYPLHVLAESWQPDSKISENPLNYEMVADYDMFAVCPSIKRVSGYPEAAVKLLFTPELRTDNYSEFVDPKFDTGVKPEELGFICKIDNDVRRAINKVFEVPVARHGCEENNLFYTMDFDDLDQLIHIQTPKTPGKKHICSFDEYLRLNSVSKDPQAPFHIPINANWMNWTQKEQLALRKLINTKASNKSVQNALVDILRGQLASNQKRQLKKPHVELMMEFYKAQLVCDQSHKSQNDLEVKKAENRALLYNEINETLKVLAK